MNKKKFGILIIIIFLATCEKSYAENMTVQQLIQSEFGTFSSTKRQNVPTTTPANPYEGMKLLEDRGLGSKVYFDGKTIYYTYTEPTEEELQRFRDENKWGSYE